MAEYLERHVGEDEEEHAVRVEHAHLIQQAVLIHEADEQRKHGHLRWGDGNLTDLFAYPRKTWPLGSNLMYIVIQVDQVQCYLQHPYLDRHGVAQDLNPRAPQHRRKLRPPTHLIPVGISYNDFVFTGRSSAWFF